MSDAFFDDKVEEEITHTQEPLVEDSLQPEAVESAEAEDQRWSDNPSFDPDDVDELASEATLDYLIEEDDEEYDKWREAYDLRENLLIARCMLTSVGPNNQDAYHILSRQVGFLEQFGEDRSQWVARVDAALTEWQCVPEVGLEGPTDIFRTIKRAHDVVKRKKQQDQVAKAKKFYDESIAEAKAKIAADEERKRKQIQSSLRRTPGDTDARAKAQASLRQGKTKKRPRKQPPRLPKEPKPVNEKAVEQLANTQQQAEDQAKKAAEATSSSNAGTVVLVLVISAVVLIGVAAILMWLRSFRRIQRKLQKIATFDQPEEILYTKAPALPPPRVTKDAMQHLNNKPPVIGKLFVDPRSLSVSQLDQLVLELDSHASKIASNRRGVVGGLMSKSTAEDLGWTYEDLRTLIEQVATRADELDPFLMRKPGRPIVERDPEAIAVAKVQFNLAKKAIRSYLKVLRMLGQGVVQVVS